MLSNRINKYKDEMNWVEYNEKLVKRGEIYLSMEFLENWNEELGKMNHAKRGRIY